jgi:hypothetical protein
MAGAGNQPLFTGSVLQQARVEVSEPGAYAAAGSAVALYGLEHRAEPNFHAFAGGLMRARRSPPISRGRSGSRLDALL